MEISKKLNINNENNKEIMNKLININNLITCKQPSNEFAYYLHKLIYKIPNWEKYGYKIKKCIKKNCNKKKCRFAHGDKDITCIYFAKHRTCNKTKHCIYKHRFIKLTKCYALLINKSCKNGKNCIFLHDF